MTDNTLKKKIKELELELQMKDREISVLLDKKEELEDTIMDLEEVLSKKSTKNNNSFFKFQIKKLESNIRELKDRMGFLRLENVKLKQKLEKAKKHQFLDSSLIHVAEKNISSKKSKFSKKMKSKGPEEVINQGELFENLLIKCPECDKRGSLKVPIKIINQTQHTTVITIPNGMVCEHSFQAYVNKFFNVIRYQVVNFKFPIMEYFESRNLQNTEEKYEGTDNFNQLTTMPLFQDIINFLRGCVDNREIIGTAIFSIKGKVLYASIPNNILFNIIREFEVRAEKKLEIMRKMFLELKSHQKICSEYIEIQDIDFVLVLIFDKQVNFGIGNMLLRDLAKKLKTLA